jgi:hypothetical protein
MNDRKPVMKRKAVVTRAVDKAELFDVVKLASQQGSLALSNRRGSGHIRQRGHGTHERNHSTHSPRRDKRLRDDTSAALVAPTPGVLLVPGLPKVARYSSLSQESSCFDHLYLVSSWAFRWPLS